jgi:hypothetical protein
VSTSWAPWESCGTTGQDGIARLRAAPTGESGIMVEGTAKGYLIDWRNLSDQDLRTSEPTHWFETQERRPVRWVLEMYAEPRPTVEFIVPSDFRGVIQAKVQVREDAPCPPGQRCFSYAVPPSGVVEVIGPPLVRRVFAPDFRARRADGTVLSREAKDGEVGLWWLKYDGSSQFFVIGTPSEFQLLRTHQQGGAGGTWMGDSNREGRGKQGRWGKQTPTE